MMQGFWGLLQLWAIFFYVGLFAIGGGLVAASFMQQILVEKMGIISLEKFYSMLAISESTPGPIGINIATFCGTELYGPIGGIITTLGEITPSLIIIILVARFFSNFQKKRGVQAAFEGIRPATSGMVMVAMVNVLLIALFNIPAFMASNSVPDLFRWKSLIFYGLSLVVLFCVKKLHPVFIVFFGAIFGIIFL